MKKGMILATLMLSMMIFGITKVNAEEGEYMSVTKTSLHTYISKVDKLCDPDDPTDCTYNIYAASYREITNSQGSYTFNLGTNQVINKLAYNVFGNFQQNETYYINWEVDFPNQINVEDFACSIGSYTNNTAFPPYSNTSCTIKRSDRGSAIMEGIITIEQGQYVTMVITPKIGVWGTAGHVFEENEIGSIITTGSFTLNYGNPKAIKITKISTLIGGISTGITGVQSAVTNGTNTVINEDTTYNNNSSETINGQSELNNLESAENNLMGQLDFSGASDLDITINPEASSFIWQIVNSIRGISTAIVLLMTSILGLGIIKMILNR